LEKDMIAKTFEYSVAAGAAAVNLAPTDFNPVPEDGMVDVYAVLDSGIASLTVPPTIEIVLGGSTAATPVRRSSITGGPYALQTAGNFGDPLGNPVVTNLPVRKGTNIQVNVAGGTGATATGRMRVVFRTPQETQSGVGLSTGY
jgi:hypothetical protein